MAHSDFFFFSILGCLHFNICSRTPGLRNFKVNLPSLPRLQQYPGGCGKGHDAGVMNGWLEEFVGMVDEATIAARTLYGSKLI